MLGSLGVSGITLGKSLGLEPQTPGKEGPAYSAEDAGRGAGARGVVGKKG